jgi:hypothetical protein
MRQLIAWRHPLRLAREEFSRPFGRLPVVLENRATRSFWRTGPPGRRRRVGGHAERVG